jgi:hypothetical protein
LDGRTQERLYVLNHVGAGSLTGLLQDAIDWGKRGTKRARPATRLGARAELGGSRRRPRLRRCDRVSRVVGTATANRRLP